MCGSARRSAIGLVFRTAGVALACGTGSTATQVISDQYQQTVDHRLSFQASGAETVNDASRANAASEVRQSTRTSKL